MPDNARAEDMNSRLLSPRSVTLTDMDTSFLERGSIHPAASGRVRSPRLFRLLFLRVGPGASAPSSADRWLAFSSICCRSSSHTPLDVSVEFFRLLARVSPPSG